MGVMGDDFYSVDELTALVNKKLQEAIRIKWSRDIEGDLGLVFDDEEERMELTVEEAAEVVSTARAALEDAERLLEEAHQRRRDEKHGSDADKVKNMTELEFVTSNPFLYHERPYVLPFGKDYGKWNPRDVDNSPFGREWLAGMMAIICERLDEQRTRPTRLIFTSTTVPGEGDKIGSEFIARHDQTGARLGEYRIVGLVIYAPDGGVLRIVGNVPDIKFPMSTYK